MLSSNFLAKITHLHARICCFPLFLCTFVAYTSNRIILDRSSYDFGKPKWHLLEVLKVPSVYRGLRLVYKYDNHFHDDFNVSEELRIEYDD